MTTWHMVLILAAAVAVLGLAVRAWVAIDQADDDQPDGTWTAEDDEQLERFAYGYRVGRQLRRELGMDDGAVSARDAALFAAGAVALLVLLCGCGLAVLG